MAGLTERQLSEIWDMTEKQPMTVKQIADKLGMITKKAYLKVYRVFTSLKYSLNFLTKKEDGLLWIRANPQNPLIFSDNSLDLICDKQKSEKTEPDLKTESERQYEPLKNLKRAGPERLEALLKLNRIQSFGHFEGQDWIKHNKVEDEVKTLYMGYRNRVKHERLEMSYSPSGSPVFREDYTMEYKTRFTNKDRQQDNINGFRYSWNKASSRHCVASELTLTARPYGYKSLVECNQKTLEALEKFLDYMRYHLPDDVEYICVKEFQKNGRIHFHLTFFGINWLMHKSAIQYAWRGYGGGEILDIHTIRRRGSSWHWSRSRPEEATGTPPYDHLRKYLEKSMSPEEGFMFWAMGCKNWTSSLSLLPETEKPTKKGKVKNFLKGVISKITGYRISHRSDSDAFFSGALEHICEVLQPMPKDKPKEKEKPAVSFRRACELIYNP